MSNVEETSYYGAANAGTFGQQTGTAVIKLTLMKEEMRLGDEGVDFPDWLRKTTQEAQLLSVFDHLIQAAKPELTRAEYGGADTYKTKSEISLINRRTQKEVITACELLRNRIAPNSEEMGLIVKLLDEHKPFEALNLLEANCDKKDYGRVVERLAKLFKPSTETTTIGISNETRRLLG